MILRITDSLARKLRAKPAALLPLNANAFADWSVQYTRVNRKSLLVLVNTRSLYTVAAPFDGIVTLQSLESRVYAYLKDRLHSGGFEFLYRRLIAGDTEKTTYSKLLSAQSSGDLNDLVELLQYLLTEEGLDEESAARKINGMGLSALDGSSPCDTFQRMGI